MWDERHIPALFRKPLAEGRLLVVSPVSQTIRRVDARSAAQRNRYILDHADKLFLGALDPDGSLTDLLPLPSHLYKCEGSGRPLALARLSTFASTAIKFSRRNQTIFSILVYVGSAH